MIAL
ncbi:hypothetical protein VCEM1536_000234A, partial [Vibrio cholerae O1 str. EM-1536]|jgi:Transposase DDE domain group 1